WPAHPDCHPHLVRTFCRTRNLGARHVQKSERVQRSTRSVNAGDLHAVYPFGTTRPHSHRRSLEVQTTLGIQPGWRTQHHCPRAAAASKRCTATASTCASSAIAGTCASPGTHAPISGASASTPCSSLHLHIGPLTYGITAARQRERIRRVASRVHYHVAHIAHVVHQRGVARQRKHTVRKTPLTRPLALPPDPRSLPGSEIQQRESSLTRIGDDHPSVSQLADSHDLRERLGEHGRRRRKCCSGYLLSEGRIGCDEQQR